MNGLALYNEIDDFMADWLEGLIAADVIAPGVVDRRSVVDLVPAELAGYSQVHLFAGLGGWSAALRSAGWPDDRQVWTWSEPCQPFSQAGAGLGFADERYLRPFVHHLVSQCRPATAFGEQVASKDGLAWRDVIQADMEGEDYAFWCPDVCSAGFGAPHIRQRLYWVADAQRVDGRREYRDGMDRAPRASEGEIRTRTQRFRTNPADGGPTRFMADDNSRQRDGIAVVRGIECDGAHAGRTQGRGEFEPCRHPEQLADNAILGRREERQNAGRRAAGDRPQGIAAGFVSGRGAVPTVAELFDEFSQFGRMLTDDERRGSHRPNPTNGFWSNPDWLLCRDGKWRPVESGTFPLAHGLPRGLGTSSAELRRLAEVAGLDGKSLARAKAYRVGSLGGYGNAINIEQATEFVRNYLESERAAE